MSRGPDRPAIGAGPERLLQASLLLAGAIHVLPLPGVLGKDRLADLYGVEVNGPDMELLLRHRAVLFALFGGLLLVAAFTPALRWTAVGLSLLSAVAFVVLAVATPERNDELDRVLIADLFAVAALLLASALLGARARRP